MRDGSRDVFRNPKTDKYSRSSTWKRRLRRIARKHAQELSRRQQTDKEIYCSNRLQIPTLIRYWKQAARNG